VAATVCSSSTRPVLVTREVDQGPIQRVVIALDLSPHSERVLQVGLEAAILLGTSVCLTAVVPPTGFGDLGGIVGRAIRVDHKQLARRIKSEVNKAFDRFQQQVELPFSATDRLRDVRVDRRVLLGDPVAELVSFTAESDSDLLVFGSVGQRDVVLPRQLGRVASSLAASAVCHVLVVPPA
jgi:nucleotide-binding universal stress UspA family protein